MVQDELLLCEIWLKQGQLVATLDFCMERCLEVWDILMVYILLLCEKSVVVDVILHTALVSPEQLIVSWFF